MHARQYLLLYATKNPTTCSLRASEIHTDLGNLHINHSVALIHRGRLSDSLSCGRVVGLDHAILSERCSAGSLRVDVLFARAIDGNLDSDLTAVDLLAIHLTNCLLLELLRSKGYETEATSLAGLVAGLEFLYHVASDGTKSDLGGGRVVSSEEFLELVGCQSCLYEMSRACLAYLLLTEVIGEVGDHDLVL